VSEILKINPVSPEPEPLARAAGLIQQGGVVAIPTDTLFCLVADPFNLAAVGKVYQAKSRAWDRSLPWIVESVEQVVELAQHLPSRFYLLAHRYWPGPLTIIVEAADAISGARPGARRESLEQYVKRVRALEEIANSFEGVQQSFALQAGREVRIIVRPEAVDDLAALQLSRNIAKKIEETMTYPGQIKVTVIRETRATEFAK